MSSSSVTASGSRSPSPRTPDVSDSSTPIIIHNDHEPSWYQDLHPTKPLSSQTTWASSSPLMAIKNPGEEDMLRLDELLESHAYEDSPSPEMMTPVEFSPMSSHSVASPVDSVISNFRPNNLLVPSHAGPVSLTKPIPPPAAMPRKADPSMLSHRVVRPPKESCFNLPIMFPSIPEGGTKSRVETQVRVTVDLADASSSSDPYRYARVGSWKWLKLLTGPRPRDGHESRGKLVSSHVISNAYPDPQEILHLSANVTCASPPHNRVLSCSSCQAREAKRVAKKLAARVRPARSDSESGDERTKVLDFSTGSVVLPLRITFGFNVHFTLMDQNGRIVGTGSSRPIMITDDHKTVAPNQTRPSDYSNGFQAMDTDWSRVQAIPAPPLEAGAPSKRKKDHNPSSSGKKRAKPYDSSGKPTRPSREGSISSIPSPLTPFAALPLTRSPSPHSILQQYLIAEGINTQTPALHQSSQTSDSQTSQSLPLQLPTIHRLIPNMGPTHGGIEVTILGANFHASLQLNCLFGDVVASSTHRWSDNALVCLLPPRASAGVVAVSFDGMELALQVVGLKMTGKIEDAKNVAMRIVGNAGNDNSESHNGGNTSNMMQVASLVSPARDLRSLLFVQAAISHSTPGGQTLLHLAAFLGFSSLVKFLTMRGVDLDARDRNGYTALHFAALSGSKECAQILLSEGADREIVNASGRTPEEIAPSDLFDGMAATPPIQDMKEEKFDTTTDAKHTASIVEMIQRTLAQFPAAQGIIPNLPQLPLPQLPQLPGMPAVPWVFVPMMPGWPHSLAVRLRITSSMAINSKATNQQDP
ncbi:hypothetical protein BD779DRAFT_1609675 [Infundibulicybe gibba]|nr:hypothetical protein BD779DRAFT_1609675 [Infundibulicybe gibba]